MERKGTIFDIKRFAIHDGPGIRTTVFFKGCPLKCWACHNPEGQAVERELIFRQNRCNGCRDCLEVCEQDALSIDGETLRIRRDRCIVCGTCATTCLAEALEVVGKEVTAAEVMETVERDVVLYDESGGGVTFSGGEPMEQPEFLEALLDACEERRIHSTLDTCGHVDPDTLRRLSERVGLFLYDLKMMDGSRHEAFAGVSNDLILENLRWLSQEGRPIQVRCPLIPGVNDDEENARRMGKFLSSLKRPLPVEILPYHRAGMAKYNGLDRSYPLPDTRPPLETKIAGIARILSGFGIPVLSRGNSHGDE